MRFARLRGGSRPHSGTKTGTRRAPSAVHGRSRNELGRSPGRSTRSPAVRSISTAARAGRCTRRATTPSSMEEPRVHRSLLQVLLQVNRRRIGLSAWRVVESRQSTTSRKGTRMVEGIRIGPIGLWSVSWDGKARHMRAGQVPMTGRYAVSTAVDRGAGQHERPSGMYVRLNGMGRRMRASRWFLPRDLRSRGATSARWNTIVLHDDADTRRAVIPGTRCALPIVVLPIAEQLGRAPGDPQDTTRQCMGVKKVVWAERN